MSHPVTQQILDLLLPLSPEERGVVLTEIECNDIFCASCGIGTRERPNGNCQCWNEE